MLQTCEKIDYLRGVLDEVLNEQYFKSAEINTSEDYGIEDSKNYHLYEDMVRKFKKWIVLNIDNELFVSVTFAHFKLCINCFTLEEVFMFEYKNISEVFDITANDILSMLDEENSL